MNAQWHPDVDLLADATEELPDAATVQRVEAHLAGCPDCRAVRTRLESVRAILGSQSAPRMPDDVTARVLAALTAERTTVTPLSAAREGRSHRRRLRQALAAAAAIVAIGGVGALGVSVLRETGLRSPNSTEATSTTGGSGSAGSETSGGGPAAAPGATDQAGKSSTTVVATGRAYTPANLATAATQLLSFSRPDVLTDGGSTRPSPPVPQSAEGGGGRAFSRLRDPAVLPGCIEALTGGRQAAPLVVDLATYDGRPAAIVVVSSATPDTFDVYVVGPDCSASGSDLIASTTARR
jgi:hypothetical protein